MTLTITARNVNDAFSSAWFLLGATGVEENSRNGPVLVPRHPVVTTYKRPQERVLFNSRRDANAVFHLMEALWMLAGEDNVQWLRQFNSNIPLYAEPDGTIHGAYGARWRKPYDQIHAVIDVLRRNPQSRQAVMQMWRAEEDLEGDWRDRPCNTAIYFDCRGGALNMTVTCRSNDILWGCYGANVVHMSVLQELIAHAVGLPMGEYRQFSNNWHAYLNNPQVRDFLDTPPVSSEDYYVDRNVQPHPLLQGNERYEHLLEDCAYFLNGRTSMRTHFMRDVAVPLRDAYLTRASGGAVEWARIPTCDWGVAFTEWCDRRKKA